MTDARPTPARTLVSWRALFAVAVWGASFVAIRFALRSFTPSGLVATRLVVGSLMLGVVLRRRGGPMLPLAADRGRCVFLGVVLGVHLLVQAVGLRYTTAINTGWIIAIIPAMIAVGSHFVLRQRLRVAAWGGVLVATAGVLLVTSATPAEFARAGFGDMLQLGSCVTWTVYTLAASRALARSGSLRVSTMAMSVAALVVLVGALVEGVLVAPIETAALAATAFLAVVCSGLGYLLWFQAVERDGAARVGAVLYFEPLFTVATAVLLLGEPLGGRTILGGAVVLAGVWLVVHRPTKASA